MQHVATQQQHYTLEHSLHMHYVYALGVSPLHC